MTHGDSIADAQAQGLQDHSEELSERTEAEAQIRFYQAMAQVTVTDDNILRRLAKTVADVLFDFCLVYHRPGPEGPPRPAAIFHPNDRCQTALEDVFSSHRPPLAQGLIRRITERQESYFRPRWSPQLLVPHGDDPAIADRLGFQIHSLIAVPLMGTDDQCMGALMVGRHTTSLSFDETDLALIEWIASHAAMKLETAQLYEDLKQTNQRLDAALDARDNFIAIAAHQLRSPLGTLKLQAEMMRRSIRQQLTEASIPTEAIDRLVGRVDDADRQVDYIGRIVDQLLDASTLVDGALQLDPQPCDLRAITQDVTDRFSHLLQRSDCQVRLHAPDHPLTGRWDPDCVDHILSNLISNAIKYAAPTPITITLQPISDAALIFVEDRGPGISPDDQQRIFQRFERANQRQKGLGLGLWIVQAYAQAHGGEITLDSTPGEGSTFRITLPFCPPDDGE